MKKQWQNCNLSQDRWSSTIWLSHSWPHQNALIKAVENNENYYTASEELPARWEGIVGKNKGKGFDVILSKNVSLTLILESIYNIQKMLRIDNMNLIFNDTIKNI